jgi:hypothetical protein
MKRNEPLGKREKRYPIGLSHSELVNIVLIDPKTGKKRIFKTTNVELIKPAVKSKRTGIPSSTLIKPTINP